MRPEKNKKIFIFFILYLGFLSFCGCATTKLINPGKQKSIFFPPEANEPPRLQFLTSFSSSKDLGGPPSVFKKFIIGEDKDVKPILKPYGLAVHDNKIYVCDTVSNSIDILDLTNNKFEYFRPKEEFQLSTPINLCFDESGNMLIADSTRGQVVIFDKNGNYLGEIGKKSEFKPTDILIKGGKVYICDLKTRSIRIYESASRKYLSSIPKAGAKEEARLFSPTNIALDEEGNLYVTDTGAFRVQKYDSGGEFLMSIGSHGDSPGQFARPKGVAVDKNGRIYVVDAAFENVQFFNKKGKLLLSFGGPGTSSVPLVLPAGIVLDYSLTDYFSTLVDPNFEVEYLVLVSSQYGERKINVFGFGHRKQ